MVGACEEPNELKFLCELDTPLSQRIRLIAREVYVADGVSYLPEASTKLKRVEKGRGKKEMGTCMVKTHLSPSHDPALKGAPKGWTLPVRHILTHKGAGFVAPVAGTITFMPVAASTSMRKPAR